MKQLESLERKAMDVYRNEDDVGMDFVAMGFGATGEGEGGVAGQAYHGRRDDENHPLGGAEQILGRAVVDQAVLLCVEIGEGKNHSETDAAPILS